MPILKMSEVDLRGKRVFMRVDFNVPRQAEKVSDDTRIRAALPGIREALGRSGGIMLASHLGRPTEGKFDEKESLAPVARHLSGLLGKEVPLRRDWLNGVTVEPGKAVLLENCRFNNGEKENDDTLSRRMAALCDVYVNDAFGTAHRAEATTHGIAKYAPIACAGPLMAAELDALGKALLNPKRPLVAIVGGAKVSTKLTVLRALLAKVDTLIVGGGIANTFILAAGGKIGKSLAEPDLVAEAKSILAEFPGKVPIPIDAVCAKEFAAGAKSELKAIENIATDDLILDLGPQSIAALRQIVARAGTIVWNGPIGVFEFDAFANGTRELGQAIAASRAFSIAGGGDTVAAINKFGIADRIGYISTAGGAFLEFLEGKTLPAVAVLEERAAR